MDPTFEGQLGVLHQQELLREAEERRRAAQLARNHQLYQRLNELLVALRPSPGGTRGTQTGTEPAACPAPRLLAPAGSPVAAAQLARCPDAAGPPCCASGC